MADPEEAKTAEEFDSESASIFLIGNDQERDEALRLIDKHLRQRLVGMIRHTTPGLPTADLLDVYQQVLLEIWQKAQRDDFDPEPLIPLLFTMAKRRAIDWLRQHSSRRRTEEELLDGIAERLRGTQVGAAWQEVAQKDEARRILALIREAINKMPDRQRQVAGVMVEYFPDVPPNEQIRDEIFKATGELLTVTSVKRARQEALAKIREQLARFGYDPRRR